MEPFKVMQIVTFKVHYEVYEVYSNSLVLHWMLLRIEVSCFYSNWSFIHTFHCVIPLVLRQALNHRFLKESLPEWHGTVARHLAVLYTVDGVARVGNTSNTLAVIGLCVAGNWVHTSYFTLKVYIILHWVRKQGGLHLQSLWRQGTSFGHWSPVIQHVKLATSLLYNALHIINPSEWTKWVEVKELGHELTELSNLST